MAAAGRLTVHEPRGTRLIDLGAADAQRDLAELLRRAELPLNTRCGRQGLCEGCLVELLSGMLVDGNSAAGMQVGASPTFVRACQCLVPPGGEAEIRIPERSLLAHEPQIVSSFRLNVTHALEPVWQRRTVRASELDGNRPSAETIRLALSRKLDERLPMCADPTWASFDDAGQAEIDVIVEYRGDHWRLRPLLGAESARAGGAAPAARDGAAAATPYGVAVDIGTTTVVILLVDLSTGEVVATASALNAQAHLGDNVLTRINLCMTDPGKLRELQEAIAEKTLAPMLDRVLTDANARIEQVVAFSMAGNTTMLHLLAGVDPSSMGAAPFTPQFLAHRILHFADLPIRTLLRTEELQEAAAHAQEAAARRAGRAFATEAAVHLLPSAAAYIGADITVGVFSSGMAYRSATSMLVDIGTNGEIVIQHDGRLFGCATAAGPAFEGAGLNCGVRAGQGAVCHVRWEGDPLRPYVEVIGGGKPIGLCGTAYVDFLAQARRHGLISSKGRITPAWADSELVHTLRHGRGFLIGHGRGKEPLVVSEADIASLMQAKAAIAAGIVCLLERCGVAADEVETLYLAGGFGFHMDLANLLGCGMLPGFEPSQIQVVGNTSLGGAYLALLDAGVIEEVKRISARLEVVELNLEPDFTSCYVEQLFLP